MKEGARPPFTKLSWTGSLANDWILHEAAAAVGFGLA